MIKNLSEKPIAELQTEQAQQWEELAKVYTAETGVQVTVLTAASGTYEQTLASEIVKKNAPTLFQVNGPKTLATWKDYCADLTCTELYKNVKSDDFVLKQGDAVVGIAYRTGHFNTNSLIVADGYEITAADREALRAGGILISDAVEM